MIEGEKNLPALLEKMSICQKYAHLHNWGVWPKMHQSAGHFFRCDNSNSPPAGMPRPCRCSKYIPPGPSWAMGLYDAGARPRGPDNRPDPPAFG